MENPKVDAVFGQHIGARAPGGAIAYRRGATMASADSFYITVKGVGGHAASPWQSKDPILTGAQIVTNLQSIVSRQADLSQGAAVVTVGQFNAGNRTNIIPEEATLAGTIRTLNEPTRKLIHEAIARMAKSTAEASGLTAEVKIVRGYPVLENNAELVSKMLDGLAPPVLFAANHASHLDTPVIFQALPGAWRRRTSVVAAMDYFFKRKTTGWMVSLAFATLPLERTGLSQETRERIDRLVADGWNLLMYPEGTRTRTGQLGPLHTGCARLAIKYGIPIVPIYLRGTFESHPKGSDWPKPHKVVVRFGKPLPPPGDGPRREHLGRGPGAGVACATSALRPCAVPNLAVEESRLVASDVSSSHPRAGDPSK